MKLRRGLSGKGVKMILHTPWQQSCWLPCVPIYACMFVAEANYLSALSGDDGPISCARVREEGAGPGYSLPIFRVFSVKVDPDL